MHPTKVVPLERVQDDVHQPLISIDAKCFVAVGAVVVAADCESGTVVVGGGSWSNWNLNP